MGDGRFGVGTVVKLLLASLFVGLVLAVLGVTPDDLLATLTRLAAGSWNLLRDAFGWAGSYILLGALVVIPVWLLRVIYKRLRRR